MVRWKLQKVKNAQELSMKRKQSLDFKNRTTHKNTVSIIVENAYFNKSQDSNSNLENSTCTKHNYEASNYISPAKPETKLPHIFQQESAVDMAITHTWFVALEVTTFLVNASVVMYAYHNERLKDAAPLGTVLYASFWFGMSSSFFNFLLYNIRIPAFRKASWELITSVRKVAKLWKK